MAALSELWLGLRDHGPAAGLTLADWRRLPDGFSYRDPHTGADRRLAAGAELRVRLGAVELRALVFARVDRIPRARLGPVLARWDTYLAAPASASVPTAALVLTRTARQRAAVLEAARGVLGPPARALLSVAAEVHAERGEVRRATCPAQVTTLRMGTRGLRHPVRSPGVSGLVPPATPERTGCQDASSHAEAAGGPPVEKPDCIGECA